ncbi:MAG: FAD-dependent oxidoreductase [Alphaproteobacteria bacterium HGW-Alphaproteobacteria-2]|nr:MAG: FAD-dependent oxidoreductase [Alphaproteobacteria bacterium HGW-Alphaproteobacteria-2]
MPHDQVIIIGGGASGVILAAQLLRRESAGAPHVILVERDAEIGQGIAYGTADPQHLLNSRAANMSAFPDEPAHFCDWLAQQGLPDDDEGFVSRGVYGRYLQGLIADARNLQRVQGEAVRVEERTEDVVVHLEDGRRFVGDAAVLATGHLLPRPCTQGLVTGPWDAVVTGSDDRVLIVGSGLTMIDHVTSLLEAGHEGEIIALSRRGLLPQVHRAARPLQIDSAEIPFGKPVSSLMRWLRAKVAAADRAGVDWRSVVDGFRPHVRAVWQSLPQTERKRYLRHGAAWWDIHRHRTPPVQAERVERALASGQLRLLRGRFLGGTRGPDGQTVARCFPPGETAPVDLAVERIIDCRGIRRDPLENPSALLAGMLARGQARIDPLRLGVEVSAACRLIDAAGRPASRILCLGPVTRAAFWEITAIPDIREQAADIAQMLTPARVRHALRVVAA